MSNINIVVCAEKTEYKVALKNKITSDELSIIGYADFQPDAKVRIQGFVPDVAVFVLDSEDINSDFFNFVEDINLGSFGCSAIIMTDNVTVDIVNNAAQSGIRRVMSINIGNEEFTNTIKNVVGNEKKLNQNFNVTKKVRSRVYSFFSGKGGVGKTTICTNTAVYLATLGKKVLLVDLDLQFGDADMALDLNPSETIVDLARDTNGISIDNAALMRQACLFLLLRVHLSLPSIFSQTIQRQLSTWLVIIMNISFSIADVHLLTLLLQRLNQAMISLW